MPSHYWFTVRYRVIAQNLLDADPGYLLAEFVKAGVKGTRSRTAWDNDHRVGILRAAEP